MTYEEVLNSVPFDVQDFKKYKSREDFLGAWEKHLSIAAVKAEMLGNKELTATIDKMRSLITNFGHLTKDEEKELMAACHVLGEYNKYLGKTGNEKEEELSADIAMACQEYGKLLRKAKESLKEARKLETKYRKIYGKPSGSIKEEFYTDDLDNLD